MTALLVPRRYQLTKAAVGVVVGNHPWIFRSHLSSAATVFADGQWLQLVDGHNRVVGHGVFQASGAIAIRVVARGTNRPKWRDLAPRIDAALALRADLRRHTDAFRAIHGESDRMPAVVVEVLAGTVVGSAYATGLDGLTRLAARHVAAATGATGILLRTAHRRADTAAAPASRVLRGTVPETITIQEDGIPYVIDPRAGQKGGAFLDLRALRRTLATRDLAGARVLNLFAYTGMLGRAAERAGAASILHVDSSRPALDFAARHHVDDPARHRHVADDVFTWLFAQPEDDRHDVVIVDPPAMTSRAGQVGKVLATYRKLFGRAAAAVAPGGLLVTACCTSRVRRADFAQTARAAVGDRFTLDGDLVPEPDHPVGFAEADYLKIMLWRRSVSTS
jgi:23S rRNA (cytosine1962-C5)-methyltransferase